MARALLSTLVAVALFLGAIDAPTAHRCALMAARAADRAASVEGHGCCPESKAAREAQAVPDSAEGSELCAGDCCGSDDAPWLGSPTAELPDLAQVIVVPPSSSALRSRPSPRSIEHVAWPRGPPHPPPRRAWLRHRSLLL